MFSRPSTFKRHLVEYKVLFVVVFDRHQALLWEVDLVVGTQGDLVTDLALQFSLTTLPSVWIVAVFVRNQLLFKSNWHSPKKLWIRFVLHWLLPVWEELLGLLGVPELACGA